MPLMTSVYRSNGSFSTVTLIDTSLYDDRYRIWYGEPARRPEMAADESQSLG
jgi:hypothetical protein